MLSRFSDVLQSAADVLAPPPTRLEDFEYHWKMIVNFYQNYDDSTKTHIEETRIPHHLHQMLQLLVNEEKEQRVGMMGPCMEAVVNRSVWLVEGLAALAASERPAGARAAALTAATAMLRRLNRPPLDSPSLHTPLLRMLIQCNETPASPTEREEIELLLTICGLARKDPGLANIFTTPYLPDRTAILTVPEYIQKLIPVRKKVQTPKKNPLFEIDAPENPMKSFALVRNTSLDETDVSSVVSSVSQRTQLDETDKFILIDLLLTYLDSADNQVVLRSLEGLLMVLSLPQRELAAVAVGASAACERLAAALAGRYRALPRGVPPASVDNAAAAWPYMSQESGDRLGHAPPRGQRELSSFFSWLDYCDTLMKECHPLVAAHLARCIRNCWLEGALEPALCHCQDTCRIRKQTQAPPTINQTPPISNEKSNISNQAPPFSKEKPPLCSVEQAVLASAVAAKCLKVVDAPELINEFSNWLVGDVEEDGEESEWVVLWKLLDNCLTGNHDLTFETLRFLETILEKGTEHSINRLVLSRVCTRSCLVTPPSDEDERDRLNDVPLWRERESNREAMKQLQHEEQVNSDIADILQQEGLPGDPDSTRAMQETVSSFLVLVPRALLSGPVGADFDHYIHDAHRQYQYLLESRGAISFETGGAHTPGSSTHSYDSRPEADLPAAPRAAPPAAPPAEHSRLLNALLKLLSRMARQPYRVNLQLTAVVARLALWPQAKLLRPNGALMATLRQLAMELAGEVPSLKHYRQLIDATRQRLMHDDLDDESGDHNQLIECLIVLEEFCKELAAIAFVKYHHAAQVATYNKLAAPSEP